MCSKSHDSLVSLAPRRRHPPIPFVQFPDIAMLRTPLRTELKWRARGAAQGAVSATTASSLSHATKAAKAMGLVSSKAEEWILPMQ